MAERKKATPAKALQKKSSRTQNEIEKPEISEIISKFPPEEQEQVLSAFLKISRFEGPSKALLFDKFTETHITQFLNQINSHDERESSHLETSSRRNFIIKLICIFASLGLVVFFTYTIGADKPLFERIIFAAVTFGIGFAGGSGLRSKN